MYRLLVVFSLVFSILPARMTTATQNEQIPFLKEYRSVVRVGHPQSSLGPNVPLLFKDRLQINESVSYRTAIRKDKQSGIKDLRKLCNNAFLEEYWSFFPDEKLWVEMSYDEKIDSTGIDFNYFKDVVMKKDNITIYHIHLNNYLKSMESKGYDRIPETWLILPSFEDIALMVYFSSMFYKYHPEGNIVWYICSPLGITEYLLSDKGINHFTQIKQDAFFLEYFCPGRGKVMSTASVSTFDISASHDVDDLIEWANVQGKGYFEIRFFPYKAPPISITSLDPK